jgi:hypothetical protein
MRVNPGSNGNDRGSKLQSTVPSSLTNFILKNNPVKKSTASKGPNSSYAKGYKAGVAVGKLKSSSASITKSMKKNPLVKMGNAAKTVAKKAK